MKTAPLETIRAHLEERLALMAPARRLRLSLAEVIVGNRASQGMRVMDAGCGDGLLTLALAKRHRDWTLLGIDRRGDMLEGARKRAEGRGLGNARFAVADLERPLPNGGFDAVLALECLSEIPDDARALEMMTASLRPGGRLVVQVPERDWRPVLRGSASTWREQVRQGYGAEELRAKLVGAGLEQVDVRPTYRSMAASAQEIRDRVKGSGLLVRSLAFPPLAAAVWLERRGVTWGRANALIATARAPGRPTAVS